MKSYMMMIGLVVVAWALAIVGVWLRVLLATMWLRAGIVFGVVVFVGLANIGTPTLGWVLGSGVTVGFFWALSIYARRKEAWQRFEVEQNLQDWVEQKARDAAGEAGRGAFLPNDLGAWAKKKWDERVRKPDEVI